MRSPSLSSSSSVLAGAGKKEGLKRGPWTSEEDEMLSDYIRREGEGRWRTLPKKAGLLRCGKSCRLRWMNYLRPSVKRGHITPEEEDLILRLHRLLGNRWSLIAGRIPGRTDNEVKNYWNTHLSKKLISQGIDPKTHKPLVCNVPNRDPNDVVSNKQSHHHHHDVIMKKHGDTANDDHVDDLKKDHTTRVRDEDGDIVDDMAITCCSDDAFASFLNSLINDDMFNNNNKNEEEQEDEQTSSCLI